MAGILGDGILSYVRGIFNTVVHETFDVVDAIYQRDNKNVVKFREKNTSLSDYTFKATYDARDTYFDEPKQVAANTGLKPNVTVKLVVPIDKLIECGLYSVANEGTNKRALLCRAEDDYFIVRGVRYKVIYAECDGFFESRPLEATIRGQEVEKSH